MYELSITSHFSSAHRLREYDGACENLHGHNWKVRLTVKGEQLNSLGMLMDFRDLKQMLNQTLDRFDHVYLNDLDEFKAQNPTTENVARVISEQCAPQCPPGLAIHSVTVWETPGCGATYTP